MDQSWKRTGGWALEKIVVARYSEELREKGVKIFIANKHTKQELMNQVKSISRIEADKADVLLTTRVGDDERLFGVVNVKASFAERRTDDVPLSKDLIEAGYYSPLWTMDCKSSPSAKPFNKGELGKTKTTSEDERSAKRKDIEEDGYFSVCFSYNANTLPTPENQETKSKILVCNFNDFEDAFVSLTTLARDKFLENLK